MLTRCDRLYCKSSRPFMWLPPREANGAVYTCHMLSTSWQLHEFVSSSDFVKQTESNRSVYVRDKLKGKSDTVRFRKTKSRDAMNYRWMARNHCLSPIWLRSTRLTITNRALLHESEKYPVSLNYCCIKTYKFHAEMNVSFRKQFSHVFAVSRFQCFDHIWNGLAAIWLLQFFDIYYDTDLYMHVLNLWLNPLSRVKAILAWSFTSVEVQYICSE